MKKQVKLKEKESVATNSDFYNLFRPIAPSIDIIGKVAQVISGLTEAITIWYITQSEMAGSSKMLSIIVSVIAMILVVALLELGGRKFLQVLTRALVWKRLKNAWYIALFAIVSLVTIGMGALSFKLSTNGIHHAFVSNVPVGMTFDTKELKAEYRVSLQDITAETERDLALLKERHQELIQSKSEQYDARIAAATTKADQYVHKYKTGAKWAKSHANKYQKKSSQLETEKAAAIAKLQNRFSSQLDDWRMKKDQSIAGEKTALLAAINKGEDAMNTRHASKFKNAEFWGVLFSFFVGFSVLLAFVCIISVEVFRRGSGIQVEYREEEEDLSIPQLLWQGLTNRCSSFVRTKAERFAGMQQLPTANRGIGFEYPNPMVTNEGGEDGLSIQ